MDRALRLVLMVSSLVMKKNRSGILTKTSRDVLHPVGEAKPTQNFRTLVSGFLSPIPDSANWSAPVEHPHFVTFFQKLLTECLKRILNRTLLRLLMKIIPINNIIHMMAILLVIITVSK